MRGLQKGSKGESESQSSHCGNNRSINMEWEAWWIVVWILEL